MAVLNEMLKNLDSLTDEELAELMSRLEVEKSGRKKEKGVVYDSKGGVAACPHCGSVTIVRYHFMHQVMHAGDLSQILEHLTISLLT